MPKKLIKSVFRAYDIRGIVDEEIDRELAFNLGRALAHFWEDNASTKNLPHKVAVGYDARLSSPALAHAMMEGFARSRWEAVSIGLVPTPVLYFTTMKSDYLFGVEITGSHNPSNYNGFKMSCQGQTLSTEDIKSLYVWLTTHWLSYSNSNVSFKLLPILRDYSQHLIDKFKKNLPRERKKLTVVVDSGNGAGGPISTQLYLETGHKIIPLFDRPDGNFPNHHPDPSEPHNLEALQTAVAKERADFGIAFDGDADRIGVVLPDGSIVYGDQLLTLYATEILQRKPGSIIMTEVKASQMFFDEVHRLGGRPYMWKTGHSLIKAKMKEVGAEIAGEMSGHIFFSDGYLGFDDAIYAGLRLIEWAQNKNNDLAQFIHQLPRFINTPEIRVDCSDQKKFAVVDKVIHHFSSKYTVDTTDGARIQVPGKGWGLIRASNTQPVLVLRFEADTPQHLQEIRSELEGYLQRIVD